MLQAEHCVIPAVLQVLTSFMQKQAHLAQLFITSSLLLQSFVTDATCRCHALTVQAGYLVVESVTYDGLSRVRVPVSSLQNNNTSVHSTQARVQLKLEGIAVQEVAVSMQV